MAAAKARARVGFLTIDLHSWFGEAQLRGARQRADRLGLDLLVVHGGTFESRYEWEAQRNHLHRMIEREAVDALLVATIFCQVGAAEGARFLSRFAGLPVVTLTEKYPGLPAVRIDNGTGVRALVAHLADRCGGRRFAAITGPADDFDSRERLAVLRAELGARGIPLPPEAIWVGNFGVPSAREGVRVLVDERKLRFDALVCFNDQMGLAAMEELRRRGLEVPRHGKVTGFDDTTESVYGNPPLTTVRNPAAALAAQGIEVIHGLLRGAQVPELSLLPTAFVPRLSCGEASLPGPVPRRARRPGGRGAPSWARPVARAAAEALSLAAEEVSEGERRWFRRSFRAVAARVVEGGAREQLEARVLGGEERDWSAEPWLAGLSRLRRICAEEGLGGARALAALGELIDVARVHRDAAFARSQLALQREERLLFQLGEELTTGFDLAQVGPVLARFAGQLGIANCLVAAFTDPARTRARLVVSLEDGRLQPPPEGEFPAAQLLPGGLLARHRALALDALHVREELLGYFLVDVVAHPGVMYESLRRQLSAALEGAQLMGEVRRGAAELERKVEERTRSLAQVNRELTAEIERREQAERELLRHEHLEALGVLAGGIAHDFNNILTAILGSLTLLQEREGDPAERRESYEEMLRAVAQARALTHQLLAFAKGGTPVKRPMELVPLIRETALFLLRGSTVRPRFDFPDEPLVVEMDQHQIGQVLNNLILNAVQAMPEGGTLDVRVRRCAAPGDAGAPGEVRVAVADTGVGIAPEIIDRIFDPYFTTKVGGTGLGLATSLAILRRHGGDLQATSTPGQGAEFELRLPLSRLPAVREEVPASAGVPGGLSILVLEDDEWVADVFRRILGELGERCRITADGHEAVELYREALAQGAPYDLVITDLTIPGGFGGAEVVRRLREVDGAVRAIVTSGYSDLPVLAEHERFGFRAVLRKPFGIEDVRAALRAALGA
jgi:signal transduction histidine kinase/DNA-binding LacI/PurR family transcriptional regulator/CheY-like chemotaxis protein